MKKSTQFFYISIFAICISLLSNNAKAQYGNVWAFGYHYGLDFNSGNPVFFDTTAINYIEGSASICDSAGQLLFYTDGTYVWNKLHQQMPNGHSMAIGISTTQPAVIVPMDSNIYYIFTVDTQWEIGANTYNHLKYHIVDMNEDSGLGDIVLKNQILNDHVTEKLTATRHCNGQDWWIISKVDNSDEFVSFLLTPNGVSNVPVISHTNFYSSFFTFQQGQLKISPNGKFLAVAHYELGTELGSFNNSTGEIQSIFKDFEAARHFTYGCSFSSDSKYAYYTIEYYDSLTANDSIQGNEIIEIGVDSYYLGNTDSASIVQSKTRLLQRDSIAYFYGMQLGPDNKIYVRGFITDSTELPQFRRDKLFVIKQDSDSISETSLYFPHPNIGSSMSLPSFPDAIFTNHHKASLRLPTCIAGVYNSIQFYDSLLTTTRDYIWDFGDPASGINNTYNGQFPIHQFSAAGTYTVTLSLPSDCNLISVTKQVNVTQVPPTIPIITLNNSYLESTPAAQYQWYLNNNIITGAIAQTYVPVTNGNYSVSITDSSGCSQTSQIFSLTTVGLNNTIDNNQFTVYPNPANNLIYINNPSQKQATIIITDILGNIVLQSNIAKQFENINISQLNNGIYIVNIDNSFNHKLVVNK